jgi:glutathione S-transferase
MVRLIVKKIMALLGYTKLDWYSELTSKGVPRPVQEILVGNYSRRIPILQIGADIYCDTKEICHQIAEISGIEELSFYHLSKEQQHFADELEYEFGRAVVAKLTPMELIISYFKHIPMKDACTFLIDRLKLKSKMKENNPLNEKSNVEWTKFLIQYFKKIDNKLENHSFLSLEASPNYIDFTTYTHIWYSKRVNNLKYAKDLTNIRRWLKRMDSYDLGNYKELSEGEAIEAAKQNKPKSLDNSLLNRTNKLNKSTSITINDGLSFIMEPVQGILLGENDKKSILKRENRTIGTVHVHLPKNCHGACG